MTLSDKETAQEIASWLTRYAQEAGLDITPLPGGVERNANWLHIPVAIHQELNAYDRAQLLQDLEDAWNDARPIEGVNLLLVPAGPERRPSYDFFGAWAELLDRQNLLLDQYEKQEITQEAAEKFLSIREASENVLKRMERLRSGDGSREHIS